MLKVWITLLIGWLVGLILLGFDLADPYLRLGTAYKTKAVCSEVFVAGRSADDVLKRDFARVHPVLAQAKMEVDHEAGTVTGRFAGLFAKTEAVYRPGLGCALAIDGNPDGEVLTRPRVMHAPWPVSIEPEIQALTEAARDDSERATAADIRALVVVQDGVVIAENYADGFGPDRPMQSWSMAKSVTQALTGIAIEEGLLSLDDRELMPGWEGDDPRAAISLNNLMHMADGLGFVENYSRPRADATRMLFGERDMGVFASTKPLAHEPGSHWSYSSGTTNIISTILRKAIESDGEDYHSWPYEKLFGPLGINTAVFETDAGGTFIGSSYLYMSPRDWARLGQLYLDQGTWRGRQILPEAAVAHATTSSLPENAPFYGAQWWLNRPTSDGFQRLPGLPDDAYFMGGHDGQMVIVVPSKSAVIVRLGLTRPPVDEARDVMPSIAAIVDAL